MKRLENTIAIVFGVMFLVLALLVSIETGARKLLNVSLQGVDELGGYCLAVGGALAFASAFLRGAHIRIDILYERLHKRGKAALNVLAVATIAASAVFMLAMAWISFSESVLFQSTVMSPWATPLRYPQAVWLVALGIFAALALLAAARILVLLFRGDLAGINQRFSPFSAKAEIAEEVADLRARGTLVSADDAARARP